MCGGGLVVVCGCAFCSTFDPLQSHYNESQVTMLKVLKFSNQLHFHSTVEPPSRDLP